jgi:hypothetical protein
MESEKITRQEIEKAQALCLAYIEAKERMADYILQLKGKFIGMVGQPDLALWSDWVQFAQVIDFMLEKDAVLEKRLQEAGRSMSAEKVKEMAECTAVRGERPWPGSN